MLMWAKRPRLTTLVAHVPLLDFRSDESGLAGHECIVLDCRIDMQLGIRVLDRQCRCWTYLTNCDVIWRGGALCAISDLSWDFGGEKGWKGEETNLEMATECQFVVYRRSIRVMVFSPYSLRSRVLRSVLEAQLHGASQTAWFQTL